MPKKPRSANATKRPAKKRGTTRKQVSKDWTYDFLVPAYIRITMTFRSHDVAGDHNSPEIVESACEALEKELHEYLAQDYAVDRVTVDADGFDTVFLGSRKCT